MIAITGYSGFIGRHLLANLSEYECLLLGRNDTDDGHRFCEFDLNEINKAVLFGSLKSVKTVIHLAARVHVMNDSKSKTLHEFKTINTKATLEIATQAAAAGAKRFIFLSSIKVNGERTSNNRPFCAQDKPAPEDAYAISKAEAEDQLIKLGKQTGLEIVIIRAPLVYGEGVKANFASLMKLVSLGLPLPFGLIKYNQRSLVSVYNLVNLITLCIEHPKAVNQVFLVSDDSDLSTAQMVSLMARVQGKRSLALPVPQWCFAMMGRLINKNDVVERLTGSLQVDISHTKNTLDWKPSHTVEEGFSLAAKQRVGS